METTDAKALQDILVLANTTMLYVLLITNKKAVPHPLPAERKEQTD